jgi:cyanophycin synthetase
MRERTAAALVNSVARRGKPGRLAAPRMALAGLPDPLDMHRVRRHVRELLPGLAAGRAAVYREIWESAAARAGATTQLVTGGFLEICRGDAVTTVRENLVQLDDPVTLAMAGDRAVAGDRLTGIGLPVPEHLSFDCSRIEPALAFLRTHGRCVVKPARDTGAGAGVTCDVRTTEEFVRAALTAVRYSPDLVIERQLSGTEHRLLVLDGEVVGAIRRLPPSVVGDGRSTLTQLLMAENQRRVDAGGRRGLYLLDFSLDAAITLRRQGLRPTSVLPEGTRAVVAGAANTGGAADCESEQAPPALAADAVRAVGALGLRWASVEVSCEDATRGLVAGGGGIIEVNSTPGVSYHYQVSDPATVQPVAESVLAVLLRGRSVAAPGDPAAA